MPRKNLIYTPEFPYHITARSNNREWFYLPIEQVWDYFVEEWNQATLDYGLLLHAFVLMSNHYHAIVTTHEDYNLGVVMQRLQRRISSRINKVAGRTNHVFGGPYKASLIRDSLYYRNVIKYLYCNPIEAGISSRAQDYKYSSIHWGTPLAIASPLSEIVSAVPKHDFLKWINQNETDHFTQRIRLGLKKTVFSPVLRLP